MNLKLKYNNSLQDNTLEIVVGKIVAICFRVNVLIKKLVQQKRLLSNSIELAPFSVAWYKFNPSMDK